MFRHVPRAGAIALAAVLAAGGALAQSTTGPSATPPPGATSMGPADRQFAEQAAMSGLAEVQIGRMAQQRTQNPQVREFANRMVDDHGKANGELVTIAQAKGLTLPAALGAEHRAHAERLAALSGPAFDKEYLQMMVADHDKAVTLFMSASQRVTDPELKAFASQTLPRLQEHQALAKSLNGMVAAAR